MKAIANWYWQFDTEKEQLRLNMGEVHFDITYKRRLLQQTVPSRKNFSVTDARVYHDTTDYLELHSSLSVSDQLLVAIHATAIQAFGKPSMPQSWYFQFGEIENWPQTHRACSLDSGMQRGEFIILQQDERGSLCLLLDETMSVSPSKTLKRYDVVRVSNDRLLESKQHAFTLPSQLHSSA